MRQFNASSVSARIEGGYRYATRGWNHALCRRPVHHLFLSSYAEQVLAGPGTFALNYAGKDVTSARTELGVRLDKSYAMQRAILTLRAASPGRTTSTPIAASRRPSRPAWRVLHRLRRGAAAKLRAYHGCGEMKWLNGWSGAAIFESQFSDINRTYTGKGVVRYSW